MNYTKLSFIVRIYVLLIGLCNSTHTHTKNFILEEAGRLWQQFEDFQQSNRDYLATKTAAFYGTIRNSSLRAFVDEKIVEFTEYLENAANTAVENQEVESSFTKKVATGFEAIAGGIPAELQTAVLIYQNPEHYAALDINPPHCILLHGPPGTGKSSLARAFAKEINAYLLEEEGSSFIEKYVGVGASRIRELFSEADRIQKLSEKPVVVCIDEIDAFACSRDHENNSEYRNTLTSFLVAIDQIRKNPNIFVIVTTNRLDSLDKAVIRPERFDYIVHVPLPDMHAREKIIRFYLRNRQIETDSLVTDFAIKTERFSGAHIKQMINNAAINAANEGVTIISKDHLERAYHSLILAKPRISMRNS